MACGLHGLPRPQPHEPPSPRTSPPSLPSLAPSTSLLPLSQLRLVGTPFTGAARAATMLCHVATTLAWATGAPIGRRSCCYLRSLRQHRWRLRSRRLVARAVVVASVLSAMARRRRGAPRHRPTWHSGYGQHKAALHGSERPRFKGMSSHLRARHLVIAVEHMVASLQYEHWATWRGDVPTVRAARDDGRRAAQGSCARCQASPCKAAAAARRRLGRAVGHLTRTARRACVPWGGPVPACWDNRLFSLKPHPAWDKCCSFMSPSSARLEYG